MQTNGFGGRVPQADRVLLLVEAIPSFAQRKKQLIDKAIWLGVSSAVGIGVPAVALGMKAASHEGELSSHAYQCINFLGGTILFGVLSQFGLKKLLHKVEKKFAPELSQPGSTGDEVHWYRDKIAQFKKVSEVAFVGCIAGLGYTIYQL